MLDRTLFHIFTHTYFCKEKRASVKQCAVLSNDLNAVFFTSILGVFLFCFFNFIALHVVTTILEHLEAA